MPTTLTKCDDTQIGATMIVQVSTRVDKAIRDAAATALEADGLDLSTGIRMFIKRTADQGTLPFSVGAREDLIPSLELMKVINEAKAGKNLSEPMELEDALSYLDDI
jgi:addiction module RelB/DinJ family antitoxin